MWISLGLSAANRAELGAKPTRSAEARSMRRENRVMTTSMAMTALRIRRSPLVDQRGDSDSRHTAARAKLTVSLSYRNHPGAGQLECKYYFLQISRIIFLAEAPASLGTALAIGSP